MSSAGYIKLSLWFSFVGTVMIILPCQYAHKPEWCYDCYSVGLSLFTTASFLLIVGLSKRFTLNDLELLRIPTAVCSFMTIFDACKEVVGANHDNSTFQLFCFIIGVLTTILIQYAIYRKRTD